MNNICDLFLAKPCQSDSLKLLHLFDKSFDYDSAIIYQGFLGVSIHRVKLIPLLVMLREQGHVAYNISINYRDNVLISEEKALEIAKNNVHFEVSKASETINPYPNPMFHSFVRKNATDGKVGGGITVDALDGHIWTLDRLDIYQYDYNNLF